MFHLITNNKRTLQKKFLLLAIAPFMLIATTFCTQPVYGQGCLIGVVPTYGRSTFDEKGGVAEFNVSSASTCFSVSNWEVSSYADWITILGGRVIDNNTLRVTFRVAPSQEIGTRDNSILVTGTGLRFDYRMYVTQRTLAKTCALSDYKVSANISAGSAGGGAGTLMIETKFNCKWKVDSPQWITVTPSSGIGSRSASVWLSPNNAPGTRQGIIEAMGHNIYLLQQGSPCRFSIKPETLNVSRKRNIGEVEITASSEQCSWQIQGIPDWMTLQISAGKGSAKVKYDISPHLGDIERQAKLVIGNSGTEQYSTLSIRQAPKVISSQVEVSDIDGDKTADFVVFRNGYWYALPSSGQWQMAERAERLIDGQLYYVRAFGLAGDIPTLGDFDGDRKLDLAVVRPSEGKLFVMTSSNKGLPYTDATPPRAGSPYYEIKILPNTLPVCGNYDDDGLTDIGYYNPRDGYWYIRPSTNKYYGAVSQITRTTNGQSIFAIQFGLTNDWPLSGGDFTGDEIDDLAVYRPTTGETFILPSKGTPQIPWLSSFQSVPNSLTYRYQFAPNQLPVVADFDGDKIFDLVFWDKTKATWQARTTTGTLPFLNKIVSQAGASLLYEFKLGPPGDVALGADLNGDGKYEPITWQPATGNYYAISIGAPIRLMKIIGLTEEGNLFAERQFGLTGDLPLTPSSVYEKIVHIR